jgi:hypothetical protein
LGAISWVMNSAYLNGIVILGCDDPA